MIANLPLYPLGIDWTQSAYLSLVSLNQEASESIGGSQQRSNRRRALQRKLRFSEWVNGAGRRTWDAFVDVNPPGTIMGVPLWTSDGVELTSAVAAGATVLPVSEVADIDWRGELVLVGAAGSEAAAIDFFDGLNVHLTDALAAGFAAGTKVLPLLRARVPEQYAETEISEEVSEWELECAEDLAAVASSSFQLADVTYKGTPIFPLAYDLATSPERSLTKRITPTATGTNAAAWATLKNLSRQSRRAVVSGRSRSALARLLWFYEARRGGWDRFWLFPVKNELLLASNIGAADTTIHLQNFAAYSTRFTLGQHRRVIVVEQGDQVWLRKVINLAGGTDRISIDAALGTACGVGSTKIGLAMLARFATDDIEVEFTSPLIGDASLSFEELEAEYTEALTPAGTFDGSFDAEGVLS